MNRTLLSSINKNIETPRWLFDALNKEFHFSLDACASNDNTKCERYFTERDNALEQSWEGETVFCNPPYGRQVWKWVKKGFEESLKSNTCVVMLLPARTDTRWFHDYIYRKAEIRFLKGRLVFENHQYNAPFPSMVIVFKNEKGAKECTKENTKG
jgi:site-specific DNA-methyltransferase (adenine-specific)